MTLQPLGGMHENTANETIAAWIGTRKNWRADGERTGAIQGSADRPDIIVNEGDRMPVIIENEYGRPAVADAKKRLGMKLVGENRPFTEVIALGTNEEIRRTTPPLLTEHLNNNAKIFTVQFVSVDNHGRVRVWPNKPMSANSTDLVAYCEYAQVPQSVIEAKSREIAHSVRASGRKLSESLRLLPDGDSALEDLKRILGCDTPEAATLTACAIWMITVDLQNDLATYSVDLKNLGLKDTIALGTLTKAKLLESWETIKSVNYLPVIELAIPSLQTIPSRTNGLVDVLGELHDLSDEMNGLHAKHIYNFAGELWQELVPDREERAAHYTKPEVAELLSQLGAVRFSRRDMSTLANVDLMDLACGTGTLIGAGERALRRLHGSRGGTDIEMHKKRMENHIIAMDVNGIAGTLTAKRLTDMDVQQVYDGAKIVVSDHPAGSLSLLDPEETGVSRVLGYRDVTQVRDDSGNRGLFHIPIEDLGVDWALMNPPYSRPRIGRQQATVGLKSLRDKAKRRGYDLSNGQAGLGSDFGNVSLMRLKGDGVISHVLPLTAAHAKSWQQWREGIETHFKDIIAIANTGLGDEESMSADTGMNEMLMIATKKRRGSTQSRKWRKPTILCVNLRGAPTSLAEGYALANEIESIPLNQPMGESENFSYARLESPSKGFPWYGVGSANSEFSAVMSDLLNGKCYDPGTLRSHLLSLDMTTLGTVCETGPTHHLIGHLEGRDEIGAFKWTPVEAWGAQSAQQSLWSADSKKQTTLLLSPTHNGQIEDSARARGIVEKRSQWFISRNLRWTSQAVAFAHTEESVHGGNAWNALQEMPDTVGQCITLFCNSIFGAVTRQVYAQSTQPGRAMIHVKAISGFPCPGFSADTPEANRARTLATMWFDSLSKLELEPFGYCFRDRNRHRIDDAVAEMLGLDPKDEGIQDMLAGYRLLFAREPNVNGRQKRILAALEGFTG